MKSGRGVGGGGGVGDLGGGGVGIFCRGRLTNFLIGFRGCCTSRNTGLGFSSGGFCSASAASSSSGYTQNQRQGKINCLAFCVPCCLLTWCLGSFKLSSQKSVVFFSICRSNRVSFRLNTVLFCFSPTQCCCPYVSS